MDFFILLVLKPLKRGKDSYCISTKALGKLVGSLLQQNEYMLLSTGHLSPDYNRPGGTGAGFELHLFLPEPPALTVPPPHPPSTEPWESELLSTVGFCLLSKLKQGFLVCSVLTCLGEKMDF